MSYTDALARVGQIQAQIAAMNTGTPPSAAGAQTAQTGAATGAAPTYGLNSPAAASDVASSTASFANLLSQAQQTGGVTSQQLPAAATTMLTSGQQQFASKLAADTGLSPSVISAWLLAEESGGAAVSRQSAGNNDWLNIGYTDSGTYGASASVWSDPVSAADATAGWLKGQDTIPGYGKASAGVQSILSTAGQPPAVQVAAIQHSGWASSGYPDLPGLVAQLGG
jgi:hypothetical protein